MYSDADLPMGARQAARPREARALSNQEIHEKLQRAVFEHRLKPGTRLVEDHLADMSGSTRASIRQVLARLAHEGLVTLTPNRGARVASPTVQEAREVFAMRFMLEPAMVRQLAQQRIPGHASRLREHVMAEAAARARGDRPAIIRLSGEFHILLAELTGNRILMRSMRELCAQTCLVITLYDKPNTPACPYHEHEDVIEAIEQGDAEKAARFMTHHLSHIEQTLALDSPGDEAPDDLSDLFA